MNTMALYWVQTFYGVYIIFFAFTWILFSCLRFYYYYDSSEKFDGSLKKQLVDTSFKIPVYEAVKLPLILLVCTSSIGLLQLIFEHYNLTVKKCPEKLTELLIYPRWFLIFAIYVLPVPILLLLGTGRTDNIDEIFVLCNELKQLFICLSFLFYNYSLICKRNKGVSVLMSLLALIYVQFGQSFSMTYLVLALLSFSSVFYPFICPSKRMSCMVFLILSVEMIRETMYSMNSQFLTHDCTLALTTYRILDGFIPVLFVSVFGLHAYENMSNIELHLKIQQELIRNVSHEMRTPLAILQMSIEHALNIITNPELARNILPENSYTDLCESIDDALKSGESMVRYLNELSLYSKSRSNLLIVVKSTANLCLVLIDTFSRYVTSMKNKSIEFDFKCCDVLENRELFVNIDHSKLVVVINKFISNAMKFTKPGGKVSIKLVSFCKPLSVSLVSFCSKFNMVNIAPDDFVRIEITDTGIGLSLENIYKLFREGIQINPIMIQGSGKSGFGLALSKSLIEAHGGSVGIDSKGEGQGSTFYFELPVFRSENTTNP